MFERKDIQVNLLHVKQKALGQPLILLKRGKKVQSEQLNAPYKNILSCLYSSGYLQKMKTILLLCTTINNKVKEF